MARTGEQERERAVHLAGPVAQCHADVVARAGHVDHFRFGCEVEIVVEEESDRTADGRHLSHFEIYLEAMAEIGADTGPITRFVELVRAGVAVREALVRAEAPPGAAAFVSTTMDILERDSVEAVAAAFTFGRENVIPNMFRPMVERVASEEGFQADKLVYYLDRHIQLDGVDHAHLARRMLVQLCETDEAKWAAATDAGRDSLDARAGLWSAIEGAL